VGVRESHGGRTIAVVGGGASGVLTAVQLLRHPSDQPRTVVLIDRRATLGTGTAFGTRRPCHRLNVPAACMSAFPDDPGHFLAWARERDPSVTAATFVSRSIYGEYLRHVLRDEASELVPNRHLCPVTGEVESIEVSESGGGTVWMRDGAAVQADAVVLALGNLPPTNPAVDDPTFYESARYTRDPWAPGAIDAIPVDEPVLLIGTGLTAVDVVLSLEARGHRDVVRAVSRHGLVPHAHRVEAPNPPLPIALDDVLAARTARELLHAVRAAVRDADARGGEWRDVVDALRPHVQGIWQSLGETEQRRFVAHVARYWEVHRHRLAPEVARTFDALLANGTFRVTRGRLVGFAETDAGVDVSIRTPERTLEVVRVGHVVNCTGPRYGIVGADEPAIDSLTAAGRARPGPLGLGLDVDDRGAVLDAAGRASTVLFALGALRRGNLWESTAIPEIRAQAADLATVLLAEGQPAASRNAAMSSARRVGSSRSTSSA
jgi:uncharacterized NAD(P)/FAD-binding protein YdhS